MLFILYSLTLKFYFSFISYCLCFIIFLLSLISFHHNCPFSSVYHFCTLRTFLITPGYNFPDLRTSNIIICIPLCYNFNTLELFAYPLEHFGYPQGLKTPVWETMPAKKHWLFIACCVFWPANGCSAHHSLVEIDFLMLKQLFPSLTEQNNMFYGYFLQFF